VSIAGQKRRVHSGAHVLLGQVPGAQAHTREQSARAKRGVLHLEAVGATGPCTTWRCVRHVSLKSAQPNAFALSLCAVDRGMWLLW
jgi:hypothetical protein